MRRWHGLLFAFGIQILVLLMREYAVSEKDIANVAADLFSLQRTCSRDLIHRYTRSNVSSY